MLVGRKVFLFFFVLIFAILFNLLLIGNSKADSSTSLVISGLSKMSAGETQTLTASGGCGEPYLWSIVSGGGTLSSTTGYSVKFTASSSNPNCEENPLICVTDSAGEKTYMWIAVNAYTGSEVAYTAWDGGGNADSCIKGWQYSSDYGWGVGYSCATGTVSNYNCEDVNIGHPYFSNFNCGGGVGSWSFDLEAFCAWARDYNCTCHTPEDATKIYGFPTDSRTQTMKAAGCCPSFLLPANPSPVTIEQCSTCDLAISSFTGSSATIDRYSGGTVTFNAGITSSKPFSYTLTVDGMIFSGSADGSTNLAIPWTITNQFDKLIDPITYTAMLIATTTDGQCTKQDTANVTISANDQDCSKLDVAIDSSLNIASGNLNHAQTLFAVPDSRLMSAFALIYNSRDGYSGMLGTGWTHTYNLIFKYISSQDTYILMNGNGGRTVLYNNNGSYTPGISAYPILTKNSDNILTLTYKNGTIYTFNANGQLTTIADQNGNTVNLVYNSKGNLINIIDPAGKTITLGYDANNRISSITDPGNNSYSFTYSGNTLTAVSSHNSLGTQTWQYTYDSKAFMLTKTDPQGNLVQYSYDAEHRVSQTIDPQGNTRNIQYDPENKTTTVTEKDGGVWVYKYDPVLGALTSKTDPAGGTIQYQYDSNRNLTGKIEADGSSTNYTYDGNGNMTSVTDALGNTTTYTYNVQNLVTSITDSLGRQTKYTYDAKGNILSTTDPSGATTQYAYDSRGNITSITAPNGGVTSMAYDTSNNLISVTDPGGQTTIQTYDSQGNMISQTDAAGNKTTFQYNSLNQLVAVTDSAGKTTQYTYDANGNKLSSTDANGNTTTYLYNYKNQLIQTTDAMGQATTFIYGSGGCSSCGGGSDKLASVTDAKNQTTTYQYDQTGRLVKEADPLGNSTSYTYDANGNMISKTKPDGHIITYVYDDLNRLAERIYPNGTSDLFQYDEVGNMTAATNSYIAYYYGYDAVNRLTGVTSYNLAKIFNVDYQYDITGNRTMMTFKEGTSLPQVIKYSYNQNNQMTKIETDKGNFTFAYDVLNRRIKRTLPNDTVTSYSYDQLSRLTNITHKNAFHQTIDSFGYAYDNVGNRTAKKDNHKSINYYYDQIYRLTKATPKSHNALINLLDDIIKLNTESYSYDAVGNRQTGPDKFDAYTYDNGNAMLTSTEHPHQNTQNEYDANGNLIKKTEATGQWKTITSYTYDDENRLTDVTIQQGNKIKEISFTYDPFGRRISKALERDDFAINLLNKPSYPQITSYVYDEQNIIAEYDEKNKQVASYIYGPNIDEPLAAEIRNNRIYYHADGLGTITSLTNHMGVTVQKYDYDSFGNIKFTPFPHWIKQPYTYTGREYDSETGLYYYRARYYDAQAGRFVTKDPIGFEGGDYNLYNYVGANPVNLIDPWGLHSLLYQNGNLTYYDDGGNPVATYPATSGEPGVTDPSAPWQGPIPPGGYTLNPSEISEGGFFRNLLGDWGQYRAPLHPNQGTNTFGRKNFFLHGGKKPGSAGCIDVGDKDKDLFPGMMKHQGPISVTVK